MNNASIVIKDENSKEIEFSLSNSHPDLVEISLDNNSYLVKKDELKIVFRFILEGKEV